VRRAGKKLGGFERHLLMQRSFHFAFFTKDGTSTVNQSQMCNNWYEFGGEEYF
jgi:hypothetical protein